MYGPGFPTNVSFQAYSKHRTHLLVKHKVNTIQLTLFEFKTYFFIHLLACNLQDCLGKNTYHPEKCDKVLRQLYECCQEMYKAHPRSESSACPIPSVVDRWMKDHSK
ncbi:hypothetical protein F5877DRAFT_33621 [Lentinula edodes]|nr:hypothetical protein F5877DRAFT_33621 [Lentinula edodes]